MSEGDVSLIRDEDVLRRMWQQTEDFSRKKEIRAHMYRLREERLRNLYASQTHHTKGVEEVGSHVSSLLDQSFQGLKSKEVRDAASPPKLFTADLKELSNAGWNVESENRTTDNGHTHIRSVQANIEGRYDVEGGAGQFAAIDQQQQAATEYHDDNTNLKRNQSSAKSAAQEQVFRKTDSGTEFSSTKSSSSTSQFHEESSTRHEVPYSNDDYDLARNTNITNEKTKVSNTNSYEQSLRKSEFESGELISRKVDYPDDNTKVIVETRCLPDGTRVTSTRREFRVPAQTTKSEQRSQIRSETKSYSTTSQQKSDIKSHRTVSDDRIDIVDSQRHADDYDFKRNEINYLNQKTEREESHQTLKKDTKKIEKKESSLRMTQNTIKNQDVVDHKIVDHKNLENCEIKRDHRTDYADKRSDYSTTEKYLDQYGKKIDEFERHENTRRIHDVAPEVHRTQSIHTNETSADNVNIEVKKFDDFKVAERELKDTQKGAEREQNTENENVIRDVNKREKVDEVVEKIIKSDQYQTTYQSDYTQKKISNDWSPSHQAWASTLRADTPSLTHPTTRGSSPGSKTYQSSTSSLRSSVSPDKTYRKPSSRGGSPTKFERSSHTHSDRHSSTHSTTSSTNETSYTPDKKPPRSPARDGLSPDRKHPTYRSRPSQSPEKRPQTHGYSPSPERKPGYYTSNDLPRHQTPSRDRFSPEKHVPSNDLNRKSPSKTPGLSPTLHPNRSSISPDSKPGYMRPTESQTNRDAKHTPETKPHSYIMNIEQDHYKFVDEETKMYSRTDKCDSSYTNKDSPIPNRYSKSPSPMRSTPDYDSDCRSESPIRPTLRKTARSPSPPKGPVTFTQDTKETIVKDTKTSDHLNEVAKRHQSPKREESPVPSNNVREQSPSKYGTYDKKQRTCVEKSIDTKESHKYDSKSITDESYKITQTALSELDKEKVSPVRPTNSRESSPNYGSYDRQSNTDEKVTSNTKKSSYKDSKHESLTRHKKPSKDIIDTTYTRSSPRSSVSPTKESKYKHTTDFISTEKINEETDKKIKTHPRQLITPSSSPTRKPKVDETEPSTGQSSPTTSVSGFVYYSSPNSHEMVTDLDDIEYHGTTNITEEVTVNKRPETLLVDKRSSPSKIPCRSPSPDKVTNLTKDSPVRKSSLKKTSTVYSPVSPTEKPPSTFRVSPDNENHEFPEHKIVKKDDPNKPIDSSVKPKPPFERRETYEERCRKILGMTDDSNNKTVKRTSSFKEPKTTDNINVLSTEPKEKPDIHSTLLEKKTKDTTKTDITDFISHEKIDTSTKTFYDKTQVNRKSPSRDSSPSKLPDQINRESVSPEKNSRVHEQNVITGPKSRMSVSPDRKPSYMKSTTSTTSKKETAITNENNQRNETLKTVHKSHDRNTDYNKPVRSSVSPVRKPTSQDETVVDKLPKKTSRSSVSPDRKSGYIESIKTSTNETKTNEIENIHTEISTQNLLCESVDEDIGYSIPSNRSPERKAAHDSTPVSKPDSKTSPRSSISPDRKPNYMKQTNAIQAKHDKNVVTDTHTTTSKTVSQAQSDSIKTSRKPKESRLPSPTKAPPCAAKEDITTFIQSEREQEILDKVQKSLRKLSPERDQRSSSREKSPGKSTISLQDLEITKEVISEQKLTEKDNEQNVTKTKSSKMPTRNISPTKKPPTPTSTDKIQDSPSHKSMPPHTSRSISPKKPVSPAERPPSPHVTKPSSIKPREQTPKKSSQGNVSPTKTEKVIIETNKTSQITKQNSFTKSQSVKTTSHLPSRKTDSEPKRAPTPKSVMVKKEENKVTQTASDASVKTKKCSPQQVTSKPEIQVNDFSTTKTNKKSTTHKTPQMSTKPKNKSASSLNTSVDEDDDVLIDVEQAKSSRENSPDRICPTPVNLTDDLQTPRYPDEVKEPDDEFRKQIYHTIHETETIVDDIVEIDEEDELFVKKTDIDRFTESDECLLSVTDKVSKFTNKIETVSKPKESSTNFKDIERKSHSDFIDDNLKSDECLLSVTEKVNKFAKSEVDTKDRCSRSPSYRTTDEYDVETGYQDDYTKLSVSDKAHLFIETAENTKTTKTKPVQKIERPNLDDVDENLKSDECMLSVSDKVNKFVKTAEQFLDESTVKHTVEDKKVKEEYEKFMKKIVYGEDDNIGQINTNNDHETIDKTAEEISPSYTKDTTSSHSKSKDFPSTNLKQTEKTPTVKITTLRSSEAVKKAKELFENIATTNQTKDTKITKLTDIGVIRKSPKPHSNSSIHAPKTDVDTETDFTHSPVTKDQPSCGTLIKPHQTSHGDTKLQENPTRLPTQSPELPRSKSPMRPNADTNIPTKTVLSRYPAAQNGTLDRQKTPEPSTKAPKTIESKHSTDDTSQEKVPGYLRSTKTRQTKEEKPVETVEETEIISTRRGSGKFGVELRRTSIERTTVSSERRRSSTDHHQPCIEDIFDLGLLEQMLEKVVGYEQRRRIRAQIRVVKKKIETEHTETTHTTKTTKYTTVTNNKISERRPQTKSPERQAKTHHKTSSPERPRQTEKKTTQEQVKSHINGPFKEPYNLNEKRQRTASPEKQKPAQSPRQPSPEKKSRTTTQSPAKPKSNRFNEYASAYMKKVGLNETEKTKVSDIQTKKPLINGQHKTTKKTESNAETIENKYEERTETKSTSFSKNFSERTSSKDTIEVVRVNGKRSVSPEKKHSPERHMPGERLVQRSPSPDFKRTKTTDTRETTSRTIYEPGSPRMAKKETIIKTSVEEKPVIEKEKTSVKTLYEIEKKLPTKQAQEVNPAWVTNKNLKKTSSDSRTYSSKKIESEKTKYRAASPSKVISKPIDVITSSYGPGPLDADGRPLFGIKALRNGASNYQVKGTVIRQEFHSRNGGEPEGSVSVTAYSTEPEDLEKLLKVQGERPSRLHGLAAITKTKKFGGDTGTTYKDVCSKEERASLEQFSQSDKTFVDSRIDSAADSVIEKSEMRTIESLSDRREQRALEKTSSSVRSDIKNGVEKRENRMKTGSQGREEKTTVRQSSVKNLTEKYIKSATGEKSHERSSYPKAGLILRTAAKRDSVSSDSSAHAGLHRSDSAYSLGSEGDVVTSTTTQRSPDGATVTTCTTQRSTDGAVVTSTTTCSSTRRGERSFLDSSSKVTGVQDILTRMKNADIVIQDGDTDEDSEARALLNKFLGATVLMAGMQNYVTEAQGGKVQIKETVRSSESRTTHRIEDFDPEQCWDERVLRKRLEESSDYEERRRLRARIRALMAEQEACASAVTEALGAAEDTEESARPREEEEVTVSSSVRRDSSEKTVSSSTTTKTSKVIESMTRPAPKPVSPFAKFRQLEKQNSTNSPPNSAKTPQSPGSGAPYFKFTDPALQASAATIKERLLQWCRDKTRDYENVKLENFSTSWADGLAFCALLHHFLPDAFDYSQLSPERRRHNFTLAFKIADEKAGIYPLLDVDDMVAMRKPDWKCVFTYVQAIHRRFKDQP